jgi:eukaryotic-like serine/threonine-protein kinase
MAGDSHSAVERILKRADEGEAGLEFLHGYTLARKLGEGGFGAVYLLRHDDRGHELAIKIAHPDALFADPKGRHKFLREIGIARAVKHPNLVAYFDSAALDDELFFTMEYCRGGTVQDLLDRHGRQPVDAAARIILQALDGLQKMHDTEVPVTLENGEVQVRRGLVHRDLKPDNILLAEPATPAGAKIKIADYGMSKAFETAGWTGLTKAGYAAGTPEFMAREQLIHFRDAKPEVDLWSIAACFYYMVSGVYPRDFPPGVRGPARFLVVKQAPVVPIESRGAAIKPAIADVINRALREEAGLHYQTAAQLKVDLESALS